MKLCLEENRFGFSRSMVKLNSLFDFQGCSLLIACPVVEDGHAFCATYTWLMCDRRLYSSISKQESSSSAKFHKD